MEEQETQAAGESPEPAQGAPTEQQTEAGEEPPSGPAGDSVSADELLGSTLTPSPDASHQDANLKAVIEAIVYITEEPLTVNQLAGALHEPQERIQSLLHELISEFDRPEHGVAIREVAGGYKMATKPEHHEAVRDFVKSLTAPLKLSLPALETLAVIAYKQPVTGPEIMEIRGVQGAGVMKTLLDRKLIAVAGRKNVIGKPILYKTTKEFLVQFGLNDLSELPSLKEFEEIRRMAFSDESPAPPPADTEGPVPGESAETGSAQPDGPDPEE
jgi:segregation and condensation protein B